jgi:hypothetical protein
MRFSLKIALNGLTLFGFSRIGLFLFIDQINIKRPITMNPSPMAGFRYMSYFYFLIDDPFQNPLLLL